MLYKNLLTEWVDLCSFKCSVNRKKGFGSICHCKDGCSKWQDISNKVITKTFMFYIEAKNLSTHGFMFWGKISNEGQVFMFMDMQLLICSSWLSTPALRKKLLFLPPVPTSMIISHQLRGPLLVRISVTNTIHYSSYSLDSPAFIMI